MDIEKELLKIIEAKQGNKEMALFYSPHNDEWSISLGNSSQCVMLGEVSGQFEAEGKTIEDAITKMKEILRIYSVLRSE